MAALRQDRVLVTGASGFIGRALIGRLAADGIAVAGLCRSDVSLGAAEMLSVDLSDPRATVEAVRAYAPTLCYHLAAHPDGAESHERSLAILQTNVMGTLNLLEGLRQAGGCRIVYGCSVKVYGNGPVPYRPDQAPTPNSSYAVAKAAGREMIELFRCLYGLPSMSLRPTLVYGPGQGFNLFRFVAQKLAEGAKDIQLMGGSQTRAPVYIDDVVEAFLLAGAALDGGNEIDGKAIPLGGPDELSILDIVQQMAVVAGRTLTPVLTEQATRPTEIYRCIADNDVALDLLGWRPSVSLEEGLRRTLKAEGVAVPDRTRSRAALHA
ncbi:MAG: NAD(P)-dependent oxidoreductase [Jannaschia sp.]